MIYQIFRKVIYGISYTNGNSRDVGIIYRQIIEMTASVKRMQSFTKKWGNAIKKLANDPQYPSLNTHEISPLSKRYGMKVWQSYLENRKSGAKRMYWVYGPGQCDITIIGLEPHPEDEKNGAYD